MSRYNDYVFVLWGDSFEEVVAVTFVTELRRAGLRVQMVGLTAQREIKGAHGLRLVPDILLSKALPLAEFALCVILPYGGADIQRLKEDPRLVEFLRRAYPDRGEQHCPAFIHGPGLNLDVAGLFSLPHVQTLAYPHGEQLVRFARDLADRLLNTTPDG